MAFKIIPIERKQSLQIGILEKLAVCLMAFLIPASADRPTPFGPYTVQNGCAGS
jgi:hypothetical protein